MTRTQENRIIDYLATGKPLTAVVALKRFGTFRLAARINRLRECHSIDSKLVTRNGKRVAEYRLRTGV